jgi:hypothetical protein
MRVWIPATFPLPAIQFGSAQATYSTQGALTQLSFFVTFPTTTEALRLLQPVDSRGNCTSAKRYEEDTTSGNLALVSGDSLQYTYTGNNITSFVLKSYDEGNGLWLNVLRITSITSNANSQPTGFDAEFWDESTNSWDTSKFRFSGVTWNAGFASWFNFLGSDNYMATAEQFLAQGFKDIPRIEFNPLPLASRPDQYSISVFNGNNFVNFERSYSVVTGGRIQRITYQEWTGTAWVSLLREVFTWTGNQLTLAMSEDSSSGSWQIPSTSSRDLWTYNNNGDLTEESSEFRDSVGAPWRLYIGNQYAITYQPGNPSRIQNWIEKDYDPSGGPTGSGVWDTLSRYTLYYGAPSSVCPGCETDLKLSVYPNPMTDQILVRGLKAQTQWHVTDLNGRLITQGGFQGATSEEVLHVNAINWQAGWYLLHLVTDNGYRTVHRMVKH